MFNYKNHLVNSILKIFCLLIFSFCSFSTAWAAQPGGKKAVIFIVDNMAFSDLLDERLHNFQKIIKSGGIGLMNTRTESIVDSDRASAFLSIGMGIRTEVPEPGQILYVVQEPLNAPKNSAGPVFFRLVNKQSQALQLFVDSEYPNYRPGRIGETADNHKLKVALVGNSDTDRPHREALLMAMDARGVVGMGNVGKELLSKDPRFLGGHRTDTERLYMYTLEALRRNDIVFVDFGDIFRLWQSAGKTGAVLSVSSELKHDVMESADSFLGRLLSSLDKNTVLMIISPTPPPTEVSSINKNLTPIIIYHPGQPAGVLTSDTTRRQGLVSNIDLAPSLFHMLGINSDLGFLGDKIRTVPDRDNLQTVAGNLSDYINLKKARYGLHAFYVTVLIMAMGALYLPAFKSGTYVPAAVQRVLASMVAALPAAGFIVPSLVATGVYYETLLIIGLAVILLSAVMSTHESRTLHGIGLVSLVTAGFIITDLLLGTQWLERTPLGFDDVFMGGRYYGINNDSMGILLGSASFATFFWLEKLRPNKFISVLVGITVFFVVIISLTPVFGANVGGTIAAMSTGVVAVSFLAAGKPLNTKQVVITVVFVFLVELIIAYLDYRSGGPTHAGKVMGTLLNGGFSEKFLEVLSSKVSLFALMLVVPPYNILLAVQFYIFFAIKKKYSDWRAGLGRRVPVLSGWQEVIFYGGVVAFVFNDTGVIATALMLTYLTIPLGVLFNFSGGIVIRVNRKNIKEIF